MILYSILGIFIGLYLLFFISVTLGWDEDFWEWLNKRKNDRWEKKKLNKINKMKEGKITVSLATEFEYDMKDYLDSDGEIDMEELYEKIQYDLSDMELDNFVIKADVDGEEFDVEPF